MRWLALDHGDITEYGSHGVHMTEVARLPGAEEFRVHIATVVPGGVLGRHPTRLWQSFFVAIGTGWVSGDDQEPHAITAGEAVLWAPGEAHESGSEQGMTVVITQASVPLPVGTTG